MLPSRPAPCRVRQLLHPSSGMPSVGACTTQSAGAWLHIPGYSTTAGRAFVKTQNPRRAQARSCSLDSLLYLDLCLKKFEFQKIKNRAARLPSDAFYSLFRLIRFGWRTQGLLACSHSLCLCLVSVGRIARPNVPAQPWVYEGPKGVSHQQVEAKYCCWGTQAGFGFPWGGGREVSCSLKRSNTITSALKRKALRRAAPPRVHAHQD